MKMHNFKKLLACVLSLICSVCISQTEKNNLILNIGYHNNNNQSQFLVAHAKSKIKGKFLPVEGISVTLYLNAQIPAKVLGKSVTNAKGEASLLLPPSAKDEWNKSAKQSFIVVSQPTKLYDEATGNFDITKAKIKIDTAADKIITAKLMELKDTVWTPVKGVDVKIAVIRLGGDLNVSETATYATDSLGMATAEYKRDSLPGDTKGNLTLIARVEDNELYGNLSSEKIVPWGKSYSYLSEFDKRTLFARRGKSPIWLELIAYSIVVAVWSVIFYLVGQIKKLIKLGRLEE